MAVLFPRARDRDLIWVETPFQEPAARAVVAAARAGAFGILDLGQDAARARAALEVVVGRTDAPFGVRVSELCTLTVDDLPDAVHTVVVAGADLVGAWRTRSDGRRVVAEVRSVDEAQAALACGVDGLVAKGAESGGRVGTTGAFVLGQQIRTLTDLPVWVQGGIGRHTAAAAVAGGAAGVVVDSQIALLRECASSLPRPIRSAIAAMDGSETRVVGEHRVYNRPDLWVADLDATTTPDQIAGRLGAATLTDQALPAGQDAALASGFAARYGTVGALVAGLRREIVEHLEAARRAEPLAPGRGVATELGTRYPVVQGPMTRVSDRAPFAAAVAEGGGLPFLALALLRGETEVRPLLEETKALLGDRPWGVGVLGFVPKELRDEQLAVIRDVRPPLALIAGGRPSQAQVLEDVGIRTFLHVPAPGLLERFLKDGARRFVFEGFECGGHVGPRSSYALWETQVEVLLDWANGHHSNGGGAEQLDVLFAGGIHDERSAAMVAALAGPLAAAGARIGVLMGTAYLFTEEAVAGGAIGDEFQAQALACERTALLESGPGHVTRCAESPFVDTFEQTRRRLIADGVDHQTRWAELEGLNLGRLRVASKGLKRDGDEIVTVGRDEQRSEGMFMIGDVATLHHELTTVAALHEQVTTGATAHLSAVADALASELVTAGPERAAPEPLDIAIVGMAAVMPGAADLDEFWRNVVEGVNSITEVPADRWDAERYFDPEWDHQTAQQRTGSASKWGGYLPDIGFDAFAYGIPPASLAAIEPTQLLSLKVAADALADAGYADRPFDRDRTSVVFGAEGGTDQSAAHGFRALFPSYVGEMPPELDEWLPKITEDSFPGLLTNVIAGRIANRLDLGGKNLTVDAACASSLAALDVACDELVTGGSDVVLCGGADLHNGIQDFLLFTSVHALSTTGQCRTFDASADGIALGEGVACVVLKRLDDAERDGDRVYAVIRSVAASSDGRSLGLTAPRPDGQERALTRAYAEARIDPRDVGLVEAHGTGTVVGDRTELATLTETFARAGAEHASCVVGSVKSNIGHTKCAAGLAGLIKAAKAVHHGVLPPTLNVDRPNQAWDAETSPFVFLDQARPWTDERRVAGISAFGFGGTNFHVVIDSHPDNDVPERAVDAWPAELVVVRGDRAAVDKSLADLASRLAEAPAAGGGHGFRLRDVAAAVSAAGRGPVVVAIVADDLDDLRVKVDHARAGRKAPGVYLRNPDLDLSPFRVPEISSERHSQHTEPDQAPQVAFLFPGQGSQRPGMAGDLFVGFAEIRSLLDLGRPWVPTMLPATAFGNDARDAQRQAITDTRVAQPTLGLADLATAKVLGRFGVRPGMVAGHSYGELVALCVADALDERTLIELSAARGQAILAAVPDGDPGGMVAASGTREQLDDVLDGIDVVLANDNHPEQHVIAGTTPAIEEALVRLKDRGITAKRLPVACAFHSPVVAAASETLARHLDAVEVAAPAIPTYSNLTADVYPADAGKVRDLLAAQVANEVRFTDEVRAMYAAGARVFVEVGPGRTLTGCVDRILGDQPHLAIATDRPGDSGVRALLHALAQLAVAGVGVDVAELFEGRSVEPTRWTKPGAPARWTINGHLVRTADGEVVPGGLRPATTVPAIGWGPGGGAAGALANGASGGSGAGGNGYHHLPATYAPSALPAAAAGPGTAPADQVLVEYFRAANEIIGAGHDLVLNYLGFTPAAPTSLASAPPAVPAGFAPPVELPSAPVPAAPPVVPASGTGAAGAPGASAPAPAGPRPSMLASPDELLAKLTAIVSARTGYPEEMLGPDLDVEADLSIDSIKRLEILSELADEIGVSDDGSLDALEDLVQELASRKTLRGIVEFLVENADRLEVASGGTADPTSGPAASTPGGATTASAPAGGVSLGTPDELLAKLTAIVSARTGYPEEMLGPDLDVEADLSIDSIKRLEILSELADEIGVSDDGSLDALEDLVQELASRKTLRGIVDFLFEHADSLGADGAGAGSAGTAPAEAAPAAAEPMAAAVAGSAGAAGPGALAGEPQAAGSAPAPAAPGRAAAEAGGQPVAAGVAGSMGGVVGTNGDIPDAANRFVVGLVDAPLSAPRDPAAVAVRVTGSGPLAAALVERLTESGMRAEPETAGRPASGNGRGSPGNPGNPGGAGTGMGAGTAGSGTGMGTAGNGSPSTAGATDDASGGSDGIGHVGSGDLGGTDLVVLTDLLDGVSVPELYARMRPMLLDSTCDLLVVSPLGGGLGIDPPAPLADGEALPFGAGARGLVKTAAVEFPDRRVRLVDVDPSAADDQLAASLAEEVGQAPADAPVEVAWRGGVRRTSLIGVRPAHDGPPVPALTAESVVLLTGGARGITARVAVELAQRFGCRIELLGRSALPEGEEDPALAAATDRMALRSALVAAGWREPQAIERECDRILAEREVHATRAALAAAGSPVVYHRVDVRDGEALAAVVASVYERHGRLDGLVHGAGMLDDHLIVDKPADAFARVFATKVDGARTLLAAIRQGVAEGRARPAFVAFFGSTAGVCGNRGQADYAAANDALDGMAAANADIADRVLAIDWGPWSPEAGMVSDALAKLFEASGMGVIRPDDGVAVLLSELAATDAPPAQVTVARCSPSLMAAAFGQGRTPAPATEDRSALRP